MLSAQSPSLLIVDSFALLFRGFYATAVHGNFMKNSQGLYTNGLYQFTRYLLDAIEKFKPSHIVCAFDMGSETFRTNMYPEYKANREAPPKELIPQFDQLWELVEAFNIPCIGQVGYEADDVIGSIAKKFSEEEVEVNILTGDGDTLQLIDEQTTVTLMKKGFGNYEQVQLHNLFELKGVKHPYQIVEMKGLMGDASDNIPGCPGVGPKTAQKLIAEHDTIDGVFERIDEIKGKLKERLLENRDLIYLSRDLATIRTDMDISLSLDRCIYDLDRPQLIEKLEQLEFKTILHQLVG